MSRVGAEHVANGSDGEDSTASARGRDEQWREEEWREDEVGNGGGAEAS